MLTRIRSAPVLDMATSTGIRPVRSIPIAQPIPVARRNLSEYTAQSATVHVPMCSHRTLCLGPNHTSHRAPERQTSDMNTLPFPRFEFWARETTHNLTGA
jgi:hypothetical protein